MISPRKILTDSMCIFFVLFIIFTSNYSFSQTIFFIETFEDNDFASRGWYDGSKCSISTTEHIKGSNACFECLFKKGQRSCAAGTPSRHLFTETDEMYVGYWVKYSTNWEGSNKPYHPHEFNIMTNVDDKYIGPAITHLTLYIEQNEGRPLIALQDSKNVDQNCILQNNNGFIGCNGDFNSYQFTENHSVAACNGIIGGYDRRDCFKYDANYYYSARIWDMDSVYFTDFPGQYYKNDWHHVEVYFKLNSISSGKGIPDGKIRYWYDSKLLISYDNILFRTAQFPDMKLNQFLIAPYIGDGSPVDQTMWIDDLTVANSPIKSGYIEPNKNSREFISPNPANEFIEITNYTSTITSFGIYNVFGELVEVINPMTQSYRINISQYSSGLYFVKIGDSVCKFMKI